MADTVLPLPPLGEHTPIILVSLLLSSKDFLRKLSSSSLIIESAPPYLLISPALVVADSVKIYAFSDLIVPFM